jgi:hypothetical protein
MTKLTTVYDYQTGSALDGDASPSLEDASLAAGDTGAVCARLDDGKWSPIRSDRADQLRAQGSEIRTVYVLVEYAY